VILACSDRDEALHILEDKDWLSLFIRQFRADQIGELFHLLVSSL
jgi:hypothetical protein